MYHKEFQKHTIAELLKMQSKGKFLTNEEKKRVKEYAEETRKQRQNS
jgi:predicted transcriptional regulator